MARALFHEVKLLKRFQPLFQNEKKSGPKFSIEKMGRSRNLKKVLQPSSESSQTCDQNLQRIQLEMTLVYLESDGLKTSITFYHKLSLQL